MEIYKSLLEGNRKWVEKCLKEDPDFFKDLAKGQSPRCCGLVVLTAVCPPMKLPVQGQVKSSFIGTLLTWWFTPTTDMNMLSVLRPSTRLRAAP